MNGIFFLLPFFWCEFVCLFSGLRAKHIHVVFATSYVHFGEILQI